MNELTRLQLKASELRSKLAKEEDAEKQDALIQEYGEVEREIRKQIVLEDKSGQEESGESEGEGEGEDEDGEGREYRQVLQRAQLSEYFDAARDGAVPAGAARELQEHHNLSANQFPLDMLEERAVTPAPTTAGLNQQSIEPGVFPNSAAAHLSIPMPRVPVGTPLYPDIATNATVSGPHTDSTSVDETTGSFNVVSVAPARFQASFFYRRTDAARFQGMDAALRQNLNSALGDSVDKYIITQLAGDSAISVNNDPNALQAYKPYLTLFAYGRVDGQWAGSTRDLKSVVGTATYAQMALLFDSSSVGNAESSILNILNGRAGVEGAMGGIRVSKHIAAPASNLQTNIIRLGTRRDAVAPMWQGITLINDELTRSKTGEIVITAILMGNFKVLRKDGFYLAKTYHS